MGTQIDTSVGKAFCRAGRGGARVRIWPVHILLPSFDILTNLIKNQEISESQKIFSVILCPCKITEFDEKVSSSSCPPLRSFIFCFPALKFWRVWSKIKKSRNLKNFSLWYCVHAKSPNLMKNEEISKSRIWSKMKKSRNLNFFSPWYCFHYNQRIWWKMKKSQNLEFDQKWRNLGISKIFSVILFSVDFVFR